MSHLELIKNQKNESCIVFVPNPGTILKKYTVDYFKTRIDSKIMAWNVSDDSMFYFYTAYYKMENILEFQKKIYDFIDSLIFLLAFVTALDDTLNEIYSQKIILDENLIFIANHNSKNKISDTSIESLNYFDIAMEFKEKFKFINLDFSTEYEHTSTDISDLLVSKSDLPFNFTIANNESISEFILSLVEKHINHAKIANYWTDDLEKTFLQSAYRGISSFKEAIVNILEYISIYNKNNKEKLPIISKILHKNIFKTKTTQRHLKNNSALNDFKKNKPKQLSTKSQTSQQISNAAENNSEIIIKRV